MLCPALDQLIFVVYLCRVGFRIAGCRIVGCRIVGLSDVRSPVVGLLLKLGSVAFGEELDQAGH